MYNHKYYSITRIKNKTTIKILFIIIEKVIIR